MPEQVFCYCLKVLSKHENYNNFRHTTKLPSSNFDWNQKIQSTESQQPPFKHLKQNISDLEFAFFNLHPSSKLSFPGHISITNEMVIFRFCRQQLTLW